MIKEVHESIIKNENDAERMRDGLKEKVKKNNLVLDLHPVFLTLYGKLVKKKEIERNSIHIVIHVIFSS